VGGDDCSDASSHQRIATRTGAAVVRTRLQRDVGGGTLYAVALGLCVLQRHDLGVRAACALGVALAQYLASVVCDKAADAGVGGGEVEALLGARQGLFEVGVWHESF